MTGLGLGAGLAAMGFWLFIGAAAVAGIWSEIREKEAKQRTLQKLIENEDKINADTMEKFLRLSEGSKEDLDRSLKVGGIILMFVSPGLALLGWLISLQSPNALFPLLGVALLVLCISLGLLLAAKFVENASADRRL